MRKGFFVCLLVVFSTPLFAQSSMNTSGGAAKSSDGLISYSVGQLTNAKLDKSNEGVQRAAEESGYNFSGIDKPKNDKDTYDLRYAEFVVPIIKAIQEQQAMIKAQQKLIQNLQYENESLKKDFSNLRNK